MPSLDSLTPKQLKKLANERFSTLVLAEIRRARERIAELERTYPSASRKELATRLIDAKKAIATTSGAVSGLFGLVSVPVDLVLVTYLQISLLVDIAVLSRVNLKSARAQDDLLDLLGYANGTGPLVRAGPKVLGRIAVSLLHRGGLPWLGRAVPVVAAPLTAWLNNRALKRVGDEALRFYAREGKRQKAAE
ncbi:MAG: EcsC family protein [Deltaproteobacteria bacterium]|nr:EcsC family protein [Deltaproteobacteria bacterium]